MEFTLKTKIDATAEQIYRTWLSSDGHTKMTGGIANISDKIGDNFTAWNGYIEGQNMELEPFSRILQSWRTSQFEKDEVDSLIEIQLSEFNGQTELTLIHTNVPKSGEHYIKGWDKSYFQPMKIYFSK
jgi:activator of HSP90 ATPase